MNEELATPEAYENRTATATAPRLVLPNRLRCSAYGLRYSALARRGARERRAITRRKRKVEGRTL